MKPMDIQPNKITEIQFLFKHFSKQEGHRINMTCCQRHAFVGFLPWLLYQSILLEFNLKQLCSQKHFTA
jgi:hypothetical protein